MDKRLRILAVALLAVSAAGCASPQKARQIRFLKELVDNQRGMREYLAAQEEGFGLLSKDIAAGRLRAGIPKERVVEKYFEPIYCKEIDESGIRAVCLFRHPTKYFSSDKAYLYFDSDNRLADWEFQTH